jgi:hypothetical protein
MAFGKKAPTQQTLQQLETNRVSKVVHQTEVQMLRVPPRGTPLGEAAFLSAVEKQMVSPAVELHCPLCKEIKRDIVLVQTGTCETCWNAAGLHVEVP